MLDFSWSGDVASWKWIFPWVILLRDQCRFSLSWYLLFFHVFFKVYVHWCTDQTFIMFLASVWTNCFVDPAVNDEWTLHNMKRLLVHKLLLMQLTVGRMKWGRNVMSTLSILWRILRWSWVMSSSQSHCRMSSFVSYNFISVIIYWWLGLVV